MKRVKMLLYGEPGTGKSVFASKAPKPFFITTDDNYEWLEDFGAKEKDHQQVYSWEEAKKVFAQDFDGYDTIVVDLLEDMFKWCEAEFCKRSRIEHVSDVGFGKGYDISRNDFFLEISKLLSKNKNVILITHGITFTVKDRRGVDHTKYAPSSRIPDKVLDMIEGRLRYCLRCYMKAEEGANGQLVKKRYLSVVPKENEFGIIRGIDENTIPHDIDLEWSEFAKVIGLNNEAEHLDIVESVKDAEPVKTVTEVSLMPFDEPIVETVEQTAEQAAEPIVEQAEQAKQVIEQTEQITITASEETKDTQVVEQPKQLSNADRLAAIRAKLDALKK